MAEHGGGTRRPLVVLTATPFHGHMTPLLQLATALHGKGFSIAIAHCRLNAPDPSNHPDSFTFLPLSDDLSAVDHSGSFTNFIISISNNCKQSFREHMNRLIDGGRRSIVVIYDNLMGFAADVAFDLNLPAMVFRSSSAAYFPALLFRMQIRQKGKFLEEDFEMQDIVPNLHPLRYKDLPFSKSPIEDLQQLVAIFSKPPQPSAVIWNTFKSLEHEALTRIQEHFKVPIFTVGPLHKMTPSPPTNFLKEDTSCIAWLNKQAPKSVIYVSFGSLMMVDPKVQEDMARGLANSKLPFIWVVRPGPVCDSEWAEFLPKGFVEETKDRGLVVKWAPQKEVLAHWAVGGFWSHCGWNSTLESIFEGVPMICQPFNIDQTVNARYVSHVWKIGLELEDLEIGEIESVIRRVMVDEEGEEMRVRANGLKEMAINAVKNGGTSYDSLKDLEDFILSC